jgi:vacuolar protein sorting-associated protein 41
VLAYVTPDDSESDKANSTPRRGVQHRHNALEPELRLIDIDTKEEVCADTLTVSRYESLSAFDYHLGVLPASRKPAAAAQRGALEAFGTGLWDATMYPTRIFSTSASILTSGSGEKRAGSKAPSGSGVSSGIVGQIKEQQSVAFTEGMKIFIQSPYDCVVAVKRDLSDRLSWLEKHARYQQAWELIDEHPESVTSTSASERPESPRTPTGSSTLADFFGDDSSQSTLPNLQASNSASEKEKRRIGELWLEQLIKSDDWDTAGKVCGKVLGRSSRWEHWIWTFTRNGQVEAITPYIPLDTTPPLPSLVYEVVLGHYVSRDRQRFKELLDIWTADLFDSTTITTAIEDQLQSEEMTEGSEDWRILTDCLAKLLLAGGSYREALRCYIRLQDADAAMGLIKDYHLLDAVADDIPGLILLRVSKSQQQNAPIDELKPLTSEPIALLVNEALHGIVQPETVVNQLEDGKYFIYLYFYLRALWRGDESSSPTDKAAVMTSEGRSIVDQFADTAVELFADYDRPLLMEFLHASTYYTFSRATAVCEKRRYIPELVYLLSKTGEMKRALFLIIDELKDATQAINFAKDQKDPGLWDDLLDYSMDKPQFIRGLLSEVGTAINPITLVKRIPSGLEIEGLRDGLIKMIREYDIQSSISQGVARVLQGEVAVSMDVLRRGRNRGVKFDLLDGRPRSRGHRHGHSKVDDGEQPTKKQLPEKEQPGHCAGCGRVIMDDGTVSSIHHCNSELMIGTDNETLVGFACGHVYHLSHLDGPPDGESLEPEDHELDESSVSFIRSVGPKVTHAFLLKEKIGKGCRICVHKRAEA